MIGHQVLLSSGDSTSRVLPILEENGKYRIRFENAISYDPEVLSSVIDSFVAETNLAESYILEVENCESREVVYSFQIEEEKASSIVPCQSRLQPKGCYELLFTLTKGAIIDPISKEDSIQAGIDKDKSKLFLIFIPLSLVIFFGLLWYYQKNAKKTNHLIALGKYQFDKQHTELRYKGKKIELTSKEADLLDLLYSNANSTVEKESILSKIWSDEGDYIGRTLDVFISKLRKKLNLDPDLKIVNIRGVGYKLIINK
ncbi:winged helix-turn-helix transcriptional regulator [Hyphobacterium sp. CCMP332]|nr:winged helix-turn-helix transcriptional regulator [Hyphobacterium sp. CCMP332]